MPGSKPPQERIVSTYCYQCVAGPDLLTVRVQDGVATEINPNFKAAAIHPGGGKACVKAFGLVQKAYSPNRVLYPMKRTNPKKGRNEDPGFVRISWDEALDLVADKLKAARATGLTDESGFPRLAASFGGGGTPTAYMGTLPAFLSAWGPVDLSFGSGQGVKCTHSEHLYGELWHRAFTVCPDTPLCDYVLSFGANVEASGGVCGVKRHADARTRGMKRVQIEPHLSVTGACSAEWIPIKPKTDAAFLFAMIHVLLHETAREKLDIPFLKERTSSPYLIGPGGFFLRDRDDAEAAGVRPQEQARGAVRYAGHRSGARGHIHGRRHRGRRRSRGRHAQRGQRSSGLRASGRACEGLFAGMGGGDLRRTGRRHPPRHQRVPRARPRRRDDRDRRHDAAVPAGRHRLRQDGEQRLGRLRMLLGAHAAFPAWSARSTCRAARSAPPCGSIVRPTIAGRASSPAPTGSCITR